MLMVFLLWIIVEYISTSLSALRRARPAYHQYRQPFDFGTWQRSVGRREGIGGSEGRGHEPVVERDQRFRRHKATEPPKLAFYNRRHPRQHSY
jgi:hypothetical protein